MVVYTKEKSKVIFSIDAELVTVFDISGEMLHFPMDDIIDDVLVGDINATVYNSPGVVEGVKGRAVSFNGLDQWADVGIHP